MGNCLKSPTSDDISLLHESQSDRASYGEGADPDQEPPPPYQVTPITRPQPNTTDWWLRTKQKRWEFTSSLCRCGQSCTDVVFILKRDKTQWDMSADNLSPKPPLAPPTDPVALTLIHLVTSQGPHVWLSFYPDSGCDPSSVDLTSQTSHNILIDLTNSQFQRSSTCLLAFVTSLTCFFHHCKACRQ